MPYIDRARPSNGLEGKFSFQYVTATALLDGRVGIESFDDKRCARSDMSAMLSKVRIVQSPEIPATLDRMWVEIKIRVADGSLVTAKCLRPPGAWGAPIAEHEHQFKVRDCMRRVLSENDTEDVIASLHRFDRLNPDDIHTLMQTLGVSQ